MAQRFAHCVKEYVDCDYWDKLDEAQTEWLEAFLEAEYNAKPDPGATKEDRSRSYNKKYLARSDIYLNWPRHDVDEILDQEERFAGKEQGRCSKIAMLLMRTLNVQGENSGKGKAE